MRDPDDILKSMKKWQYYDKRLLTYNPELFKNIEGNSDEKILKFKNPKSKENLYLKIKFNF